MPRFALFNTNGLVGKADSAMQFAQEQNIDIFLLVETWLKPDDSTCIARPFINVTKNANVILDHGGRRGQGGILIFGKPEFRTAVRMIEKCENDNWVILKVLEYTVAVGYFPPTLPHEKLTEFLDKVEELTNGLEGEVIVLGDFNARHTSFGDHCSNTRGTVLYNYLEESLLFQENPEVGKWTSFSGTGRGIPDLVLSTRVGIRKLTVHETNNLGGSDHRPLTFEVDTQIEVERNISRWNVRKLADLKVRTIYYNLLKATEATALRDIEVAKADVALDPERKQEIVDALWEKIKKWIDEAAAGSCGRMDFSSFVQKNFWTDELLEMKQAIEAKQLDHQTLLNTNTPRPIIRALYTSLIQDQRAYRQMMKDRRGEVFEDIVNNLGLPQNHGVFLRMVKGIQTRRKKDGCQLDPSMVNEHAAHYRTTFGGQPMGNIEEFTGVNAVPDPGHHVDELGLTAVDMMEQLKWLPTGKAPGVDGIMGEFLKYGGTATANVFCNFFLLIYKLGLSPGDWKQALIVPIFKKKGSDKEIKNYRPIALTCICRRLYERVLCRKLERTMDLLNDYQGGFRPSRNTMDQAFCLHEIMQTNKNVRNIFLDFQAAYDMVDRRILWSRLKHRFGVSSYLIQRLIDLFDSNKSFLVISGSKSEPIENTRGLLQGSSLSPILFNFFINELADLLQEPGVPKVNTCGIRTNCLLFADDMNIHGNTVEDLRAILRICEEWSIRVGMKYNPTKCVYLGNVPPGTFQMYGTSLICEGVTMYLGIPFGQTGIDFRAAMLKRSNNAKTVISSLAKVGFNGAGWPARSSGNVYKSFVRSVLEYGISLKPLEKELLVSYQRVQNLAFRTLFSAPRSTSIKGMHRLLQTETMEFRNMDLNIRYVAKLHNSTDKRIPAICMWWNKLVARTSPSLVTTTVEKNTLWRGAHLVSHINCRLQDARCSYVAPYEDVQRKVLKRQNVISLDDGMNNVAGRILLNETEKHRHIMHPYAFESKKHRLTITRWTLGLVCMHQVCRNCPGGNEVSRRHGLECSGALDYLRGHFAYLVREEPGNGANMGPQKNYLDTILNQYRENGPASSEEYRVIHHAISMVYSQCLGYRMKDNGFWAAPEDERNRGAPRPPQDRNQAPRRPAAANPALARRRARVAVDRNRPLGRPAGNRANRARGSGARRGIG